MDWDALVPTLVGGGISLVSSVALFSLAQSAERKKKLEERKAEQAFEAFVGLQKLMYSLNAVANLARHIDTEFRTAADEEGHLEEAAAIVQPIIGANKNIEDLHVREFSFLFDETGELSSQVVEIQQRCKNTMSAVQSYNELKADYDRFVESNAEVEEVDGAIAKFSFDKRNGRIAALKVGRMNLLLADLIAALEEDRKQVEVVTAAFIERAVQFFGDDFPAKRLEVREN